MKCQYPDCRRQASTSWALVPLCEDHHEAIRAETNKFYASGSSFTYDERAEYLKIAKKIPWSRVSMGEVLPSGQIRGD